MNSKILIICLISLSCLQLVLAEKENQPRMIRKKSLRRNRSRNSTRTRIKNAAATIDLSNKTSTGTNEEDKLNEFKGALSLLGHNFGGGRTDLPENPNIAKGIPVQQSNRTVIVEGKNGNILVDNKVKYPNDPDLQNRDVEITIRDGNFYVNNNLVLKKGPADLYGFVVYSMHTLNYHGMYSFTLKIKPDGTMEYTDYRGKNEPGKSLNINYFTRLIF